MSTELSALVTAQLARTIERTHLQGFQSRHEGKVRDSYVTGDGRRVIVVTDRISAFDVVLGTIPFKGQVLNQLAAYWFDATAGIAPNHLLEVPDPNAMVVRECTPLPAEFVMRAYLTGTTDTSIWRAYERGDRSFCGHPLPEGMRRHERLPAPILTPSTKAAKGGHDISVSADELLAATSITPAQLEEAEAMVARLFAFGQARAAERGMILVDTKYELGIDADGTLRVIDEIHTPDSSRYWYADDYDRRMSAGQDPRSLDKEFVRRWLVTKRAYRGEGPPPALPDEIRVEAALRYIETFELVTGTSFAPDRDDPEPRLVGHLRTTTSTTGA